MSINAKKYMETYVKIRDKRSRIVPLRINEPQTKLYNVIKEQYEKKKPIRIIILKARQMGFSTMTGGIIFKNIATNMNKYAGIVAHKEDSTTNLFNMYKLMYENLPDRLKPALKGSNAKEIIFDNDQGTGLKSRIRCMTAGSKGIGRSFTLNYLHISELAFWEGDVKDTLLGLLQAVPNTPDSIIIIESTANGYETYKELWDQAVNGENDFIPLFVGWNELKEYKMAVPDDFVRTKEEDSLQFMYNLTNEQLMWRRWCIKNNCSNDENLFKQEYPISPDEAFISTGKCIFNQEHILNRLQTAPDPSFQGFFQYQYDGLKMGKQEWIEDLLGGISIWYPPEEGQYYTIGADTAGEGSDFFYAHVVDNTTGQMVARYRCQTDETLFARQIYALGKHYNWALINPETNFSTYPMKELERLEYPNLFIREKEDSYTHQMMQSYGFKTTSITRPIIIQLVVDMVREHPELINDKILLRECLTFVRNDQGRAEALAGKHDDGVMSYGITLYTRGQQNKFSQEEIKRQVDFKNWPEDLLEDYKNADEETRERMIMSYERRED